MGSTELAANLFRATQTEEKLRRDNVQGKGAANATHYEIGSKVRQTIKDIGGKQCLSICRRRKTSRRLGAGLRILSATLQIS